MKKTSTTSVVLLSAVILAASTANAGMVTTAAGAGAGFTLSTFATGFETCCGPVIGPLGVAVTSTGNVMVADYTGTVRVLSDVDGQVVGAANANVGFASAVGLTNLGGVVYMSSQNHSIFKMNNDGTINSTLNNTISGTTGITNNGVDIFADRALVIPVNGLDDLAQMVRARTTKIGEAPTKRFVGHLTVARVKPNVPMPRALGAFVGAEFDVTEIALVQSRLDPEGVRYETLETWQAIRVGGQ